MPPLTAQASSTSFATSSPWAEWTCLLVLLLGRMGFLLASPAELAGDGVGYASVAQSILKNGTLPPLGLQPHGLPLLFTPLAAFSSESFPRSVLWLQVVMDTAVVFTLLLFTQHILSGPRQTVVRWLAALMVIAQPFTATACTSVYTEQSCQTLIFFGILSLHFGARPQGSRAVWVAGHLLLGLSAILRTELLALNLALILCSFLLHNPLKKTWTATAAEGVLSLLLLGVVPGLMVSLQYLSTKEVGFAKVQFYNPGYMAWMRTWFALAHFEHDQFAFGIGKPGWRGFDLQAYPKRAFDTDEEREVIGGYLDEWRQSTYQETMDQGFDHIAKTRIKRSYVRNYVFIPILRMSHFWINLDGAQTILRVLPLKRPWSTAVVGLTLALRCSVLLLAAWGTYRIWFQPSFYSQFGSSVTLFRMASIAVVLRTLELGLLSPFVWAGLMEVRYVLAVFPFLLLVALCGLARRPTPPAVPSAQNS